MHGAGNDFLLVDDRSLSFPAADGAWIADIARRRTGVGSDGVILIQPSRTSDFRMRFFNPDGREADMCGNGARCVARLALDLGVASRRMTIETNAGPLCAELIGRQVRLEMPPPHGWQMNRQLTLDAMSLAYSFVNTGVPHAVIEEDDLDGCDVVGRGKAIRRHAAFAPAGTNVNFIRVMGPQALAVRTYERGVEDETLACGTGIAAAALVAARLGRVRPPVQVTARGGAVLTVDFRPSVDGAANVTLLGPAEHVFEGTLVYDAHRDV